MPLPGLLTVRAGRLLCGHLPKYLDGKQVQRFRDVLVLRAGKNPEGHVGPRLTGDQCRAGTEPALRLPFEGFGRTACLSPCARRRASCNQASRAGEPRCKASSDNWYSTCVASGKSLPLYFPSSPFFFLSIFPSVKWDNDTYLIEAAYNHNACSSVKNSHSDTWLQNFQEGHGQWWWEGREAPHAFFLFQGRRELTSSIEP